MYVGGVVMMGGGGGGGGGVKLENYFVEEELYVLIEYFRIIIN